ncbi:MAG: sulfatase-like hydrolase/transferase [Candidatus Thermoplasmatota archaeon]
MTVKYVTEEEWDFLIILDACRYDFFKDNYEDFFEFGDLYKVESPAIETIEWAEKNFKGKYDDMIYISTTPFINSKKSVRQRGYFFDGKKHFFKVIDVWDVGWDDNIQTVRPKTVNKFFEKEFEKHSDKRFILHYMQPHAPYLSLEEIYSKHDESYKKVKEHNEKNKIFEKIKKVLLPFFMKTFGTEIIWKLNKIFGFRQVLPPHMEMAWRLIGKEGLKKAYIENLRITLKNVKDLVEKMDGKIVITADHGELLGENGFFGHGPPLPRHKKLITVPWLIIEKNNKI